MPLERAVVDFLEELERISQTHEDVTDTDVREDLHLAVNHYFVWGQPQKRLPRTFEMFSKEGDFLVAGALRRFLETVGEDEALSRIPCGQARLDILQAESSKTRSGMTYDVFLGHRDTPLPPEPLPKDMFEEGRYDEDDEESCPMSEQDAATWAALQRMVQDGSDLNRPLTMDFFVTVLDQASAQTVASRAATFGFDTSLDEHPETGDWTCTCTKSIVPAFETVLSVERLLDELARDVGGYADGFGSFGNADAASPGH